MMKGFSSSSSCIPITIFNLSWPFDFEKQCRLETNLSHHMANKTRKKILLNRPHYDHPKNYSSSWEEQEKLPHLNLMDGSIIQKIYFVYITNLRKTFNFT